MEPEDMNYKERVKNLTDVEIFQGLKKTLEFEDNLARIRKYIGKPHAFAQLAQEAMEQTSAMMEEIESRDRKYIIEAENEEEDER